VSEAFLSFRTLPWRKPQCQILGQVEQNIIYQREENAAFARHSHNILFLFLGCREISTKPSVIRQTGTGSKIAQRNAFYLLQGLDE
jgi:hypothetical protein